MKKILLNLFILISVFTGSLKSQTSDSTVNKLLAISENSYIGTPLDSIISALPPGYTEMKIFDIRNTVRALCIKYPNDVWIELHVRTFTHMSPYDRNRSWSIPILRKEILYRTTIYRNTQCYRNCDMRKMR